MWLRGAVHLQPEGDPGSSGAADHLLDPPCESGDAGVDAVVVRTAAASAPAHHPGEEPAARRLLAHQGPARVSLTGTCDVYHRWWVWKHGVGLWGLVFCT